MMDNLLIKHDILGWVSSCLLGNLRLKVLLSHAISGYPGRIKSIKFLKAHYHNGHNLRKINNTVWLVGFDKQGWGEYQIYKYEYMYEYMYL